MTSKPKEKIVFTIQDPITRMKYVQSNWNKMKNELLKRKVKNPR